MPKVRKRSDTSERNKERSTKDEYVIKCGLSGHLKNQNLLPIIKNWVINTSKIENRGSLIFNRLLLYCLENKIQLPDLNDKTTFNHCFTVGIKKHHRKDKLVEDIFNTYFSNFPFPFPDPIKGNTQAIGYAASKYMTNFHNYLVETFEQKQRRWIKEFCKKNNIDKNGITRVLCKINNWKIIETGENNKIELEFIKNQKELLKIKDNEEISKNWLKSHIENLVYFNYECLKQFEEWNLKLFALAPVYSVGSHFMFVDNLILYRMLKNNNFININKEQFMKNKDYYWINNFKIEKSKGKFSYITETDGISLCIHYLKDKERENEIGNKEYRKMNNIIAIDPGRTNLIYGIEKMGNGTKTYKLTRKQYYHEAGITKANKKSQKWNKEIQHHLDILNKVSIKTTKSENWTKYLRKYKRKYNILWDHYTQSKWGRQRFDNYIKKNKCLDKFFSYMGKGKTEKPIIAYGAAKFNPTNKNELSAPTAFLSKKCSKFYTTIMIDEFNTTKMCHDCGNELMKIKKDVNGKLLEIRGLKWCSSTTCSKFVNRDKNAALNILKCFLSGNNRPNYLARNPRQSGQSSQSQALPKVGGKILILVRNSMERNS